ncbi:leptin [Elgaria multicarinata webbii]|uniref:leptin n=1 Tax=Elgaria multicarinata webbii TaxID=159646 RepID=UPI002FCD3044
MRCYPNASLFQLLCLWLTLACCQAAPVTIGQIRADIKSLAKTTMTRIAQQHFPAVNTRIAGLEFIPEDLPALNLRAIGKTLETFNQVLSNLPLHEPLNQIPYDLENLWSLLNLLHTRLQCPAAGHSVTDLLPPQKNLLAATPYTSTAVTLHRLQNILQIIANAANTMQQC